MRVSILASGSSGNCTLVEAKGATVLVDAGIPARIARLRLRALRIPIPSPVDAVIVTHAHGDHARHAQVLQRSFGGDLFVTPETGEACHLLDAPGVTVYAKDRPFTIGGLVVTPLPVSHDSPQVSLRFQDADHAVGLATDLGVARSKLSDHLSGCLIVMLESNHDPEMLASGPYPPFLKKRVASELGHLSNDQAAELLASLAPGFRHVVLMHLSEKNNSPELALKTTRRALKGRGIRIHVAKQRDPLCIGSLPAGQLELGFA